MRTALITGASRGIGAAIAAALAPTHTLLLAGRPSPALQATAERLGATTLPLDVTDTDAIAAAAAAIGELDVLVHNAGVFSRAASPSPPSTSGAHLRRQCRWRSGCYAGIAAGIATRAGSGDVHQLRHRGARRRRPWRRIRRASSRCGRSPIRCARANRRCGSPPCSPVASTPICSVHWCPSRAATTTRSVSATRDRRRAVAHVVATPPDGACPRGRAAAARRLARQERQSDDQVDQSPGDHDHLLRCRRRPGTPAPSRRPAPPPRPRRRRPRRAP